MAIRINDWNKNYNGITTVHDPSMIILVAMDIMFLKCKVSYSVTLL